MIYILRLAIQNCFKTYLPNLGSSLFLKFRMTPLSVCKLAAIIHSEKRGGVCSLARNSWVTTLQEQHTSTFSPGLKLYRLSRFLVEALLNNVSFYQFQEKWEQSFAKFKNAFKIETNGRAYIILGGNFKSFRLFLRHLEPPKNKIYGTSWYKYFFFLKKGEKQ